MAVCTRSGTWWSAPRTPTPHPEVTCRICCSTCRCSVLCSSPSWRWWQASL